MVRTGVPLQWGFQCSANSHPKDVLSKFILITRLKKSVEHEYGYFGRYGYQYCVGYGDQMLVDTDNEYFFFRGKVILQGEVIFSREKLFFQGEVIFQREVIFW